jgi:hypothetical protein
MRPGDKEGVALRALPDKARAFLESIDGPGWAARHQDGQDYWTPHGTPGESLDGRSQIVGPWLPASASDILDALCARRRKQDWSWQITGPRSYVSTSKIVVLRLDATILVHVIREDTPLLAVLVLLGRVFRKPARKPPGPS